MKDGKNLGKGVFNLRSIRRYFIIGYFFCMLFFGIVLYFFRLIFLWSINEGSGMNICNRILMFFLGKKLILRMFGEKF